MDTAQVWDRFSADLRRWLRRRVGDEHTAEDLLQEVFLRVHRHLDEVADEGRLAAWLHRIARNAVIDRARRRREHASELVEPPSADGDDDEEDRELATAIGGCLHSMITELPTAQRRALELVELDGLTQAEAAEQLGLSLPGLKSRVQRGRRELRQRLTACCAVVTDASGRPIAWRPGGSCGTADCEACDS